MSRQSVLLHIQIIDHLDNDTTQSTDLLAQSQLNPRSYSYTEQDGSTQVKLTLNSESISLIRQGSWNTDILFTSSGLGTFKVISELGEMRGEVKVLKSRIENDLIQLNYQLIMDHSIITHQTLTYTIRGAQA
jgi:uncharacterized beta-barrel protein YwiB (DUF1934 family)